MKNETEEKYIKMTTKPVGHLVGEFAMPSIVSMLITSIYSLVDTYFVGNIDTQSTAALGIVFSYMALVQAVSFFSDTDPEIIFPGHWDRATQKEPAQWQPADSIRQY